MRREDRLDAIMESERLNTLAAWALVGFVGLVVVGSLVRGNVLWAGFALVVVVLAVLPPLVHRRPDVMLPWEVLALAALPLVGQTFTTFPLTSRFVTYVAVAAVALVIAVELNAFTTVEMTPAFAVFFVVVATLGAAGVWAVARWVVDLTLGTTFLLDPALTPEAAETRLMWEFVYSTLAGVAAGVVFEGYFRRQARVSRRLPEEVRT